MPIIRRVVSELDAEMPAAGKADNEHRLVDPRELDRPHRAAANDGLKAPGQLLAPVRAREDVHVAAKSDNDLVGPSCRFRSQAADSSPAVDPPIGPEPEHPIMPAIGTSPNDSDGLKPGRPWPESSDRPADEYPP